MSQKKDKDGTILAKALLRQIGRESDQCAFWLISAAHKLISDRPGMTMVCFRNILVKELPKAYDDYCDYLRTT